MKHKIVMVMLSVMLAVGLALTGCVPEAPPVEEEAPPEVEMLRWKIPTGSPTGTYYPALTGVCRVLTNYIDYIKATATPGGGSASNSRKVNAGEAAWSLATSSTVYLAYTGVAPFEKTHENLRSWGSLHPLYVTFVVKADSGIKEVADLDGKKVAIGEPGSGDAVAAEAILTAAGLWEKITRLEVGDPESWDLLKLGKVVAAIHHTAAPNPELYAFSATTPITLIEIPDTLANDLMAQSPYFGRATVAAGTYEGQASDAKVLIIPSMLIVNKDIPDDVVYDMTTALWAHFDEVVECAPFLKGIDPKQTLSGISVPLHPGALRYYQEQGFTIPEAIKP